MRKLFLDSNFIYALLNDSDSLHLNAEKLFQEILGFELMTSVINLAELLSSGQDVDMIKILRNLEIAITDIGIKEIEFIQNNLTSQTRRTLKAADCIIIASAQINKADLLTFDKKLIKVFENFN